MNNNIFNSNFFQQTPQKQQGFTDNQQNSQNYPQNTAQGLLNTGFGSGNQINTAFPTSQQENPFTSNLMGKSTNIGGLGNSLGPGINTTLGTGMNTAMGTGMNNPLNSGVNTQNNMMGGYTPQSTYGNTENIAKPSPFSSNFTSYGQGTNWSPLSNQSMTTNQPLNANQTMGTAMGAQSYNNWGMGSKGTKIAPYKTTKVKEDAILIDLVDLTAMKEYDRNIDEIRAEDYEIGRKPDGIGALSAQQGTMGDLGRSGISTVSSPFGATSGALQTGSTFGSNTGIGGSMGIGGSTGIGGNTGIGTGLGNTGGFRFGSTMNTPGTTGSLGGINTTMGSGTTTLQNPLQSSGQTTGFSAFGTPQQSSLPSTGGFLAQKPASTSFDSSSAPTSIFNKPLGTSTMGTAPQPLFGGDKPATPLFSGMGQQAQQPSILSNSTMFGAKPMNYMQQPTQFGGPAAPQNASFAQTPMFYQQPIVQSNDPYLSDNLKIDTVEPQRPSFVAKLPRPIFSTEKGVVSLDFMIRGSKETTKPLVRTVPSLLEPNVPIRNLTVYVEGKGKIEYREPVILSSVDDIESRIKFLGEVVEISDPVGTGLNKAARVTIENVGPEGHRVSGGDKSTDEFLEKNFLERFIYRLKNDRYKKYVDYDATTRVYVYDVAHF